MYRKYFVPDNFIVPEKLETNKFRLRMLTMHDAEKDYEAVMGSIKRLRGVFGPKELVGPIGDWPEDNLTLEQDTLDLAWHQREFQDRSSFTFTVMNLDESKCLGCVYILPSLNPEYDAMAIVWVIESELKNGLDEILLSTVKAWIEKSWPFKNVAYPGREIKWENFLFNK